MWKKKEINDNQGIFFILTIDIYKNLTSFFLNYANVSSYFFSDNFKKLNYWFFKQRFGYFG